MKKIRFKLKENMQKWQEKNNKKLNAFDLIKITGIRKNTLYDYINGTFVQIPVKNLIALIVFFDCKLSDLIEYYDDGEEK